MTASDYDAPVRVGGIAIGWGGAGWRARALAPPTPFALRDGALTLIAACDDFAGRSAALSGWAQRVRERWDPPGWRDEPIVVRATPQPDALALFSIERALLRPLGLALRSVQVCAWTETAAGPLLWIARRSPAKPVDPGRLDALVGGGIAGFDEPLQTLLRECAEEAGIPEALARRARPAGSLETDYAALDAGLAVRHREHVTLYELRLPAGFVPIAADGEHEAIMPMTPAEALASIGTGQWTREGAQATAELIARRGWAAAPRRSRPDGVGSD